MDESVKNENNMEQRTFTQVRSDTLTAREKVEKGTAAEFPFTRGIYGYNSNYIKQA